MATDTTEHADDEETSNLDRGTTKRFLDRWSTLTTKRGSLDYEVAVFAKELRDEFVAGKSGDAGFHEFCRNTLIVGPSRGRMLLTAASATNVVDTVETWQAIGGWPSVRWIIGCAPRQRRRVIDAALKRADALRRPISKRTVINEAIKLGIESAEPHRKNRYAQQIVTLKAWLDELYRKNKSLPPMPDEVRAATKLSDLESSKKAAA